jgi:hypothetical protein
MADELTVSALFAYAKGGVSLELNIKDLSIDVTGTVLEHQVQNIGTTEEALDIGATGAGGYCIMVNRDTTNFVSIRQATGAADLIRLKAGEVAMFRLDDDATAPFAIADTAACDLEFMLLSA